MTDTKELIEFLDEFIGEWDIVLDEEEKTIEMTISQKDLSMLTVIKWLVEDYPRIKEMLNEFISHEVSEYKNMKHGEVQTDEELVACQNCGGTNLIPDPSGYFIHQAKGGLGCLDCQDKEQEIETAAIQIATHLDMRCAREQVLFVQDKIRKLLPPQVSVTRGEIWEMVYRTHMANRDWVYRYLIERFKSKGITVKGEK